MEKIKIGKVRRQTIRICQPIARISLSIFSNPARGLDGIFNRRWRIVRRTGTPSSLFEINCDDQTSVAGMLYSFKLAHADIDRQPLAQGSHRFCPTRTPSRCFGESHLDHRGKV